MTTVKGVLAPSSVGCFYFVLIRPTYSGIKKGREHFQFRYNISNTSTKTQQDTRGRKQKIPSYRDINVYECCMAYIKQIHTQGF